MNNEHHVLPQEPPRWLLALFVSSTASMRSLCHTSTFDVFGGLLDGGMHDEITGATSRARLLGILSRCDTDVSCTGYLFLGSHLGRISIIGFLCYLVCYTSVSIALLTHLNNILHSSDE